MYDMNDLLPPDSQWQLDEARAINSDGWITGTGRTNGQTRAFIAIPAWVIGRKIARPLGATALVPPDIELLERSSNFDTEQNAFYWSQAEGRLYAIRPVTARLRWRLDSNPGNTNRVVSVGQNIWPRTPTVHVANTPSEVQPQGVELPHSYRELQYTTATGAAVDPSAAIFNASGIGYSVLRYVKSDGQQPNEAIHFPAFDVVRTVLWDDTQSISTTTRRPLSATRSPIRVTSITSNVRATSSSRTRSTTAPARTAPTIARLVSARSSPSTSPTPPPPHRRTSSSSSGIARTASASRGPACRCVTPWNGR
jgi:hypothetical protein